MTKSLLSALHAVQKEIPTLQKTSVNPHFKNNYIPLDDLMEQVLPVLNKHDLVLLQFPTSIVSGPALAPALRTRIEHVSGEWIEDTMPLVLDRENPQGQGSAITYARRYSLMSILALVADVDDDGNAASSSSRPKREQITTGPALSSTAPF